VGLDTGESRTARSHGHGGARRERQREP
jgi:hypothetical protein